MIRWFRGAVAAAMLLLTGCSYFQRRGLDFADCFKMNVGAGLGFAIDAHVTDWISPGIGVATYTWNAGYDDRRVNGVWIESDVINTPRLAYQVFAEEYEQTPSDEFDEGYFIARLALSSLNLPNERWIRKSGEVTVEYFSLFNFGNVGERNKATHLTGHLLWSDGEEAIRIDKSPWRKGFIEIGVTAGFLHARTGWNVFETVDFLAGLVGLDPADDD